MHCVRTTIQKLENKIYLKITRPCKKTGVITSQSPAQN